MDMNTNIEQKLALMVDSIDKTMETVQLRFERFGKAVDKYIESVNKNALRLITRYTER